MPTGYTSDLYEGEQGFNDFVLGCARGMMFAIHQRDESSDNLPRKRKADTSYYDRELETLNRKESAWVQKTDEEKWEQWSEEMSKRVAEHARSAAKRREIKKRYDDMIEAVDNWDCDPMLESFRKFMLDQLESSRDSDCHEWPLQVTPFDEWCENKEKNFRKDREYYNEKIVEERERVAVQHKYIDALYESLGLEYKE